MCAVSWFWIIYEMLMKWTENKKKQLIGIIEALKNTGWCFVRTQHRKKQQFCKSSTNSSRLRLQTRISSFCQPEYPLLVIWRSGQHYDWWSDNLRLDHLICTCKWKHKMRFKVYLFPTVSKQKWHYHSKRISNLTSKTRWKVTLLRDPF